MKVYAPNKGYTGVSASVAFCNGVGETVDAHLLDWFRNHGYEVEETEVEVPKEEFNPEKEKKPAGSKRAGE